MEVRELLIKWGFQVDDKAIKNLDAGINNLKKSIFVIGGAGIAAAAGLFGLAKSVANAGDKARKAAQGIGVTTEAYQELGYVAELGGMSQEGMGMSMAKLARTAAEAGDGVATYKDAYDALGISVKDSSGELKSTDQLMMEVSDSFAGMEDGTKKTALAMDLFGRSGAQLIPTLNQGSASIGKLREEARASGRVMSDEAAKKAEDFNDSITRLQSVITGIKNTIGGELIPAITEIIDGIREWMLANRDVIKTKLQSFIQGVVGFLKSLVAVIKKTYDIASALASMFGGLGNVLKAVAAGFAIFYAAKLIMGIGQIAQGVGGLIKAMKTLRMGIILTQASALLVPILIGAAVVALGLIIEDIIAFFQGRDSITGVIIESFEKKFPQAFAVVKGLFDGFKTWVLTIWELIKGLGTIFKGIFTFDLETIKEGLSKVFEIFTTYFSNIGIFIADMFSKLWESLAGKAGKVLGSIGKFFGIGGEEEKKAPKTAKIAGVIPEAEQVIGKVPEVAKPIGVPPPMTTLEKLTTMTPQAAPIPAAMGGAVGQKITNVDVKPNISISVPPGTPPEMVGTKVTEGVENALSKMLRDTSRATEPIEAF